MIIWGFQTVFFAYGRRSEDSRGPAGLVGHNSARVGVPSAGIDADRNGAFGSGSRELLEVLVLASVGALGHSVLESGHLGERPTDLAEFEAQI